MKYVDVHVQVGRGSPVQPSPRSSHSYPVVLKPASKVLHLATFQICEHHDVDNNFSRRSSSRISPSSKRATSRTPPSLVFSKRTKAGTLLTFHSVRKAFFGSFHLSTCQQMESFLS